MDLKINKHIESLKENPLFQMSLGSKELFHSNMLAWLMESDIKIAENIFRSWGIILSTQSLKSITIEREKFHIDLLVTLTFSDDSKLLVVIENKLKSIPYAEQLSSYQLKIEKKYSSIDKRYILLTLINPSFDLPKNWELETYAKLVRGLLESSEKTNKLMSLNQILTAYKQFIMDLVALNHMVNYLDEYDFYGKGNSLFEELRLIKIHDLFLKSAHHTIAELITKKVKSPEASKVLNLKPNISLISTIHDCSIYSNFTNSTGLTGLIVQVFSNDELYLRLGVQLQANQFRYYTEIQPINKMTKEGNQKTVNQHIKFAKKLEDENLWLNRDNKTVSNLYLEIDKNNEERRGVGKGRNKNHHFCEYNKGQFLYRYDVLNTKNLIPEIVDGFVTASKYIVDNNKRIYKIAIEIFNSDK